MTSSATLSLADDEELARRFNPEDPSHAENLAHDEGTGALRLRGGALRFDDDGLSVYRVRELEGLALNVHAILTPRHPGLARATAAGVRAVVSGFADVAPEFDVHASPLTPPPDYSPAHASIKMAATYESKSRRRQAINALAAQAFEILVP